MAGSPRSTGPLGTAPGDAALHPLADGDGDGDSDRDRNSDRNSIQSASTLLDT
ncbi:unnamed protein product [Diplocarpon coronariae]